MGLLLADSIDSFVALILVFVKCSQHKAGKPQIVEIKLWVRNKKIAFKGVLLKAKSA